MTIELSDDTSQIHLVGQDQTIMIDKNEFVLVSKSSSESSSNCNSSANSVYLQKQIDDIEADLVSIKEYMSKDGVVLYRVEIYSSNGDKFTNGHIYTVLKAKVYRNNEDVTYNASYVSSTDFVWKRIGGNYSEIANEEFENRFRNQRAIVITTDDIRQRAVIEIEVNIKELNN